MLTLPTSTLADRAWSMWNLLSKGTELKKQMLWHVYVFKAGCRIRTATPPPLPLGGPSHQDLSENWENTIYCSSTRQPLACCLCFQPLSTFVWSLNCSHGFLSGASQLYGPGIDDVLQPCSWKVVEHSVMVILTGTSIDGHDGWVLRLASMPIGLGCSR